MLSNIDTKLLLLENKLNSVNPEFFNVLPEIPRVSLTPFRSIVTSQPNSDPTVASTMTSGSAPPQP